MVKDSNTRVMITLSRDLVEVLNRLANEYDISLSNLIKVMIVDNLKERK